MYLSKVFTVLFKPSMKFGEIFRFFKFVRGRICSVQPIYSCNSLYVALTRSTAVDTSIVSSCKHLDNFLKSLRTALRIITFAYIASRYQNQIEPMIVTMSVISMC